MKNYDVIYDYTDLGGDGNYDIIKREYYFFKLVPTLEWNVVYSSKSEDKLNEWVDENVKNIDERIYLKLKFNFGGY